VPGHFVAGCRDQTCAVVCGHVPSCLHSVSPLSPSNLTPDQPSERQGRDPLAHLEILPERKMKIREGRIYLIKKGCG
jgi:hypothetical protein